MKSEEIWSLDKFTTLIKDYIYSDRQGLLGVSGETGAGKSTFLYKVIKDYAPKTSVPWNEDFITWSREELMTWIDGDTEKEPVNGLRPGQLPEYSSILADELLPMFSINNRFDVDQQKATATFNMCRDRHLLVGGAVPTFFNIDSFLRARFTFYVYIPRKGVAWVFEKNNNPFTRDQWNSAENEKIFKKNPDKPYLSPNYLCTVKFDDFTPSEKTKYYRVRNEKRLKALKQMEKSKEQKEKIHKKSVVAFGILANYLVANYRFNYLRLAKLCGISDTAVNRWANIAMEVHGKYKDVSTTGK